MAKARAIIKRRKAVQNIRKITRTMQLIATARFQQVHNRVVAGRPYVTKIQELVSELAGLEGVSLDHPLIRPNPEDAADLVIVLTSNRGLCGGYNASVLRKAVQHIDALQAEGRKVPIRMIGKKGIHYFRFLGRPLEEAHQEFGDRVPYEQVAEFARMLMDRYIAGELRAVWVVYMHFISAGMQRPEVARLLPIEPPARPEATRARTRSVDWDFSPEPQAMLAELLPQAVTVSLYEYFLEAAVSEQVARMVAMKAATDAAGDMIKYLTLRYNRARQSQITLELLDIVGGAAGLQR